MTPTGAKSSYTGSTDCVEAVAVPGIVPVRDSRDIHGPRLTLADSARSRFVSRVAPLSL